MKQFLLVVMASSMTLIAMEKEEFKIPERNVKKQRTKTLLTTAELSTTFERQLERSVNVQVFPRNQLDQIKQLTKLLKDIIIPDANINETITFLSIVQDLINAQQALITFLQTLPEKQLRKDVADLLSNFTIDALVEPISPKSVLKPKDLGTVKQRLKKRLTQKATKK